MGFRVRHSGDAIGPDSASSRAMYTHMAQHHGGGEGRRRGGGGTAPPPRSNRGLYIPFYIYPSSPYINENIAQITEITRTKKNITVVVVLNPDNGPGGAVRADYREAAKLFRGAGAVVMGYVSTRYGARDSADVLGDIRAWFKLYPGLGGIFLDEHVSRYTPALLSMYGEYYEEVKAHGHGVYCDVNPGSTSPLILDHRLETFDIALTWENQRYPTETEALDSTHPRVQTRHYNPAHRGIIVHSQPSLSMESVRAIAKWYGYVYVTQDTMPNPFDAQSDYLNTLADALNQ